MIRKFLAATAEGFRTAALEPESAAKIFLAAVEEEHMSGLPLPEPLDKRMVTASHMYTATHFLDSEGRWGWQELAVWDRFLDWLSESGLLTTKVQSRGANTITTPDVASTTLEGLRSGDVGEVIPRDSVKAKEMFTNDFLP